MYKHFCHCLSNRPFGQVQVQVQWGRGDLGSFLQWVELHSHPAKGAGTRMGGAGTRMGGGRGQLQLTYKSRALGKSPALSGPALSSLKGGGGLDDPPGSVTLSMHLISGLQGPARFR